MSPDELREEERRLPGGEPSWPSARHVWRTSVPTVGFGSGMSTPGPATTNRATPWGPRGGRVACHRFGNARTAAGRNPRKPGSDWFFGLEDFDFLCRVRNQGSLYRTDVELMKSNVSASTSACAINTTPDRAGVIGEVAGHPPFADRGGTPGQR